MYRGENQRYDFMQGEESYKSKWTKNYRRNSNLEFVNSNFPSQMNKIVR